MGKVRWRCEREKTICCKARMGSGLEERGAQNARDNFCGRENRLKSLANPGSKMVTHILSFMRYVLGSDINSGLAFDCILKSILGSKGLQQSRT